VFFARPHGEELAWVHHLGYVEGMLSSSRCRFDLGVVEMSLRIMSSASEDEPPAQRAALLVRQLGIEDQLDEPEHPRSSAANLVVFHCF